MVVKNVIVLLGQSNAEILNTDRTVLPAGLRGPQANSEIWNEENSAVETLNVDGVGANLPNNTTSHTAPWFGPEMKLSELYVTELGSVLIFKYAISDTTMGPHSTKSTWNVEDDDLFKNFKTRFGNMVTAVVGGGDTVNVVDIFWVQGESDAGIEGHEEAYLGLYRRFIKEVRAFLSTYSSLVVIPWTAGLITSSVGNQSLARVNIIRSSLLKAGWNDPYYRVTDLRELSLQSDGVHLTSQGAIDLGQALYDASNLAESNTMPLEDYTLKGIRDSLRDEFGIEDNSDNNRILDEKINKGINWLVTRRNNWPFMERKAVINVGLISAVVSPTRYGSAVFTLAQVTAEGAIGLPAKREFVNLDSNTPSDKAILIVGVSTNLLSLEKQFLGDAAVISGLAGFLVGGNPTVIDIASLATSQGGSAVIPKNVSTFPVKLSGWVTAPAPGLLPDGIYVATRIDDDSFSIPVDTTGSAGSGVVQLGREYIIQQGLFKLPIDFIRMMSVKLDSQLDNDVKGMNPALFERKIRQPRVVQVTNPIYTVVFDPLSEDVERYLWIYPYFTGREVIHIKYWGSARKLIADSDIPDVPRDNRTAVYYAAGWFVATWQKDVEMIPFYRDQFLDQLSQMTQEYQLLDDLSETTVVDEDDPLEPLQGPAGFPRIEVD